MLEAKFHTYVWKRYTRENHSDRSSNDDDCIFNTRNMRKAAVSTPREMLKMVKKTGENGQKRIKMVKIGKNDPQRSKTVQNGSKWSKTVENDPKRSKMVQNGKIDPEWSKTIQSGPKQV